MRTLKKLAEEELLVDLALPELWEWDLQREREGGERWREREREMERERGREGPHLLIFGSRTWDLEWSSSSEMGWNPTKYACSSGTR